MEKLNVRFSRKVNLQIDDIDKETSDSISPSMIARAAMQIGLQKIKSHNDDTERSGSTVDHLITIENLKALN